MLRTPQALNEARANNRSRLAANDLAVMDREARALEAGDPLRKMLHPGMTAQDFLLGDAAGNAVSLNALVSRGPAILVFYRGGWCPYCNIQLRGFQALLPRLRNAGATLAAISPQLPDNSLSTAEKNSLSYPVLSDVGLHVARRFGIVFRLGEDLLSLYRGFGHGLDEMNGQPGATELPVPAVFVIDSDRKVLFSEALVDYTRRTDPEQIAQFVERLVKPVA